MAEIQGRKWRVLAILNGRTPEEVVIGDQKPPSLGPLAELSDLPKDVAEVHIMRTPALAEIPRQLQAWRPNLVYVYGGVPGLKGDIEGQGVATLALLHGPQGVLVEAAVDLFLSSFAGLPLEAVFFDFHGSAPLAQKLLDQQHGMPSSSASEAEGGGEAGSVCAAIGWPADVAAPVLPAWDFARAFFGMLRTAGVSVTEAYALASRAALAHCTIPPAAEGSRVDAAAAPAPAETPQLPLLLPADLSPVLPSCASIPAPQIEDADLSQGVAAAFPGYADLRLLAPNAELRLLMTGHSAMVNPTNLTPLGEALRGLLAAEARALEVVSIIRLPRPPPHLAPGAGAVRCDVRSPSGARCSVTLGGPVELLGIKALVQYALRQSMTADAHTMQLKVPPPGAPAPPTHASAGIAHGAPVVEGLAVTSVWCVQMLKQLAQEQHYRGLALLGIAAISTSPVSGFSPADGARLAVATTQNNPAKAQSSVPVAPPAPVAAAGGSPRLPLAADVPAAAPGVAEAAAAAAAGAAAAAAAAAVASPPAAAPGSAPRLPLPPLPPSPAFNPVEQLQLLLRGESPVAPNLIPAPSDASAAATAAAAAGEAAGGAAAGDVGADAAAAAAAALGLEPGLAGLLGVLPAGSEKGGSGTGGGGSGAGGGGSGAQGAGLLRSVSPPWDEQMSGNEGKPLLADGVQRQQQHRQLMQQQELMQEQAAEKGPLPWKSSRPHLSRCSEEQFYSDLIAFLTDRQGRQIDPATFPEAILNGSKLDLFDLYREVCSRGGYRVGNGINWKGQVFPRMRNFTSNHKMTGVGNALKRHYQVFLLEYEQAHPEDVPGDRCGICGRGDEVANDWISCDMCDCWAHFSCDVRQSRGSFKDYAKGKGRLYHCPRCSEVRRHQQMQAQAAQVAAVQQLQQQAAAATGEAAAAAAAQRVPPPATVAEAEAEADGPTPMQE